MTNRLLLSTCILLLGCNGSSDLQSEKPVPAGGSAIEKMTAGWTRQQPPGPSILEDVLPLAVERPGKGRVVLTATWREPLADGDQLVQYINDQGNPCIVTLDSIIGSDCSWFGPGDGSAGRLEYYSTVKVDNQVRWESGTVKIKIPPGHRIASALASCSCVRFDVLPDTENVVTLRIDPNSLRLTQERRSITVDIENESDTTQVRRKVVQLFSNTVPRLRTSVAQLRFDLRELDGNVLESGRSQLGAIQVLGFGWMKSHDRELMVTGPSGLTIERRPARSPLDDPVFRCANEFVFYPSELALLTNQVNPEVQISYGDIEIAVPVHLDRPGAFELPSAIDFGDVVVGRMARYSIPTDLEVSQCSDMRVDVTNGIDAVMETSPEGQQQICLRWPCQRTGYGVVQFDLHIRDNDDLVVTQKIVASFHGLEGEKKDDKT